MDLENSQIMESDLETAFELLQILKLDMGEPVSKAEKLEFEYLDSVIEQVKYGIVHKFNLVFVLTENINEDLKNQLITIPDCRSGVKINMEDFTDELFNRKTLAKKTLLEFNSEEKFFRPNQE